ncbi:MAG: D-glycerate dehydrogenase, partial [Alphaproteobacteria bacterium]|nr:D-glycerate dehydrogenase [Alphaproteobacteria bacterium]
MARQEQMVILTRKLPDNVETRMRELFNAELNQTDVPLDRGQLIDAVERAHVLVPTVTDRIDADVIAAAGPQLKLIASFGTGVDHIDLKAARRAGIIVTNTPGVLTEDTADVVMSLILSVPRRLAEGDALVRGGEWNGWAPTGMLGHRINGKRLGIIGLGRIGQAVARRARGFGMSIHYHNRHAVHPEIEQELEATYWKDLDQMLSRMDIISINCPYTTATHNLLSRERLKKMPSHAYLVNAARGGIVDEEVLTDLLASHQIAGAGLDVYENEPKVTEKLLTMRNVVLLPHIGSATIEGRLSMGDKVIINIKTFLDGHSPPDRV